MLATLMLILAVATGTPGPSASTPVAAARAVMGNREGLTIGPKTAVEQGYGLVSWADAHGGGVVVVREDAQGWRSLQHGGGVISAQGLENLGAPRGIAVDLIARYYGGESVPSNAGEPVVYHGEPLRTATGIFEGYMSRGPGIGVRVGTKQGIAILQPATDVTFDGRAIANCSQSPVPGNPASSALCPQWPLDIVPGTTRVRVTYWILKSVGSTPILAVRDISAQP